MSGQRHFALCTLHFSLCIRRRNLRATALIETAIVLPLYMLLLLGLLYFGYATLGRQRQDKATAYAAWQAGTQQAAPQQAVSLVGPGPFWMWSGPITTNPAAPGVSSVTFGDTTFAVYGDSVNAPGQWVRQGDEYYGMTINGTIPIPCQLQGGIHSLSNDVSDLFDSERVTVDLWNYALGTTTQYFNWVPGVGIQENFQTNYQDFGSYLNPNSPANAPTGFATGGGFVNAAPQMNWIQGQTPAATPPTLANYDLLLVSALNGPVGSAGEQWLQRCAVESTMSYNPPYLPWITRDDTQQQNSDNNITNFMAWQNPNPPPTTATTDCDVTLRNPGPASMRYAAEEPPQTADTLLAEVAQFLGQSTLVPPNSMDNLPLNSSMTIAQAGTPW
ncbi:MAG: TadE/TadG family type IV pilus assembly protein [Candidatus Brocadiia bacterium]